MLTVRVGDLRIVQGSDQLTLYQWNTGIARHYFCRQCGIYTHHQRRRDPLQIGVNVGCLEGVDLTEFETAEVRNGSLDP